MLSDWSTRMRLPQVLNLMGLTGHGVEVGVQRGEFSAHIRRYWHGTKLYMIDPWAPYYGGTGENATGHLDNMAAARAAMSGFSKDSYELVRTTSVNATTVVTPTSLDFVYLDADHSYEAVKEDIKAWWPKIKPGGILAGHDWVSDGWHRHGDPINAFFDEAKAAEGGHKTAIFGVQRAVTEMLEPVHEVHLTSPDTDDGWRSWLCVKM